MATHSNEYEDISGADRKQKTEDREDETNEDANADAQPSSERKPSNWSEGTRENDPTSEQPAKSEPQTSTDCSKEPPLERASQVDVTHIKHDPDEARHEESKHAWDAKEEPHPLQTREQSRIDDEGEIRHHPADWDSGHPPVDGGSGHAPVDSEPKEVISLFVRNVAKHVMEQQIVDLFSKYGHVDSAVVVRDPHSKECRGFGFVSMTTEEGARAAIEAVQDVDFEGRRISVERAKRREAHSRTPGAYMGIDRRIRERYAGMKRHRDYEVDRYQPYPPQYDMRGSSYRDRYYDPNRPRLDERPWDHRVPYGNQHFDERSKFRKRFNAEGPRHLPPRGLERDHRFKERGAPVPRESADDYI